MDDYLSEKEQIERIRAWWKENGAWIIVGIGIGVLGLAGWNWWKAHKLEQAESALGELRLRRDALTVTAPRSGLVLARSVEPGEIAQPGASLMSIADLDTMMLVVYVPEADISAVEVGQPVAVEVDAFPDDEFEGQITDVAQEAEFTPRDVQAEDQRTNLVFAVTITLDNRDAADATELRLAFGGSVLLMYALGIAVCLALLSTYQRDLAKRDAVVEKRVVDV